MSITMWDVKEPTYESQRVGHGGPSVLVWSLCYFMIHGLGGLDEVANGLTVAASGTYISITIAILSSNTLHQPPEGVFFTKIILP